MTSRFGFESNLNNRKERKQHMNALFEKIVKNRSRTLKSSAHRIAVRRHRGVLSVMLVALILTLAAVLGSASPATAADPTVIDFPAGTACDFDLRVEISGGSNVVKEFVDKNGNVVRMLFAGKGSALSFTNLSTGATFSLKANGSVTHITFNPDGSSTWDITGHNVLILFPTDVPAGPSTTLHVGRVVFTVDSSGVFTVQQVSGQTTDICAVLSQ
jgi:hypothetical protein